MLPAPAPTIGREPKLTAIGGRLRALDAGRLTGADTGARSFTLSDGTTIFTDATTRWKSGGPRLTSIAALADAVANGIEVEMKGKAEGDPRVASEVDAYFLGECGLNA